MSQNITQIVDDLPSSNVTVTMLRSLDFVVPGQWENMTQFDEAVRKITGATDAKDVWEIRTKAINLYNDPGQGYQRALWFYQTVDRADAALGAAAMANKVGERISFLSFLNRLTPKADTAQSIDLTLKVAAEMLAFCQINGLPRDREGITEFANNLSTYSRENLMRMATLICVDGLIPLGPDFVGRATTSLSKAGTSGLADNAAFKELGQAIPGGDTNSKFRFISDSFASVHGWFTNFTQTHNLSVDKVTSSLQRYIAFTDDKLDYLGAFLDMSTNYYYHTGTQSIARHVIQRAAKEG